MNVMLSAMKLVLPASGRAASMPKSPARSGRMHRLRHSVLQRRPVLLMASLNRLSPISTNGIFTLRWQSASCSSMILRSMAPMLISSPRVHRSAMSADSTARLASSNLATTTDFTSSLGSAAHWLKICRYTAMSSGLTPRCWTVNHVANSACSGTTVQSGNSSKYLPKSASTVVVRMSKARSFTVRCSRRYSFLCFITCSSVMSSDIHHRLLYVVRHFGAAMELRIFLAQHSGVLDTGQ
ncbi:hypothetical protein D3C76_931170 [compost metagenome]